MIEGILIDKSFLNRRDLNLRSIGLMIGMLFISEKGPVTYDSIMDISSKEDSLKDIIDSLLELEENELIKVGYSGRKKMIKDILIDVSNFYIKYPKQ